MKRATYNMEQEGVSLYLTMVILSVLMAVILTMISMAVSQIKVIHTLSDSIIAFYAADSGIERILYAVFQEGYEPQKNTCPPAYSSTLENGAFYEVCVSDKSDSTIFSTGTYKKTKRRIEITFPE